MKQATLRLGLDRKRTRKRQFLEQMDQVGSVAVSANDNPGHA